MKLFLAESGGMWEAYFNADQFAHTYILQSFYYADEFTEKHIIPNAADFLLDSGAFTFMQNAKSHVIWEEYLEKYADFINRNNVQKFFELDIDSIVGYERVKEYRRQHKPPGNRGLLHKRKQEATCRQQSESRFI